MKTVRLVCVVVSVLLVAVGCTPPGGGAAFGAQCTQPPQIFGGASLFGCDLSGLNLSGANLAGADLRGANLEGSNLSGADLSGANLEGANLTNADLTGANLAGAILAGSILLGALFVNAILVGASFDFGFVWDFGGGSGGGGAPECTVYCPGYNEASIDTGSDVCNENYGVPFGYPNIYFHQSESTLAAGGRRSVVTDANTSFQGALFNDLPTLETNGSNPVDAIKLRGLSLAEADYSGAFISTQLFACKDMSGANFDGATLFNSQLISMNATGVSMVGTKFSDTSLCSIDFTNADLREVKFWGGSGVNCTDISSDIYSMLSALVVFDGANLTNAQLGELGSTDGSVADFANHSANPAPGARFNNADLTGASATRASFAGNMFTGATVDGFSATQSGTWSSVDFQTTSWATATFQGSQDFNDAICPDGSTGSPSNPCFVVLP